MSTETSPASLKLADVIAEAWRVFGRYRFARPLEVCRCNVCVQPEEEARLLATPIGDLPAPLLQVYTESAHSSSPYADEQFRALLPRYFELCADGDWPAHSVEVTFRRLVDTGWRVNWPSTEVALIERYFEALLGAWLGDHGALGQTPADAMLCLPAYGGGEVDPLLAVWDADTSVAGALKLADFISGISWGKRVQRLGAFWEDLEPVEAHVIDWLRRPETHRRLEDAFFRTDDPHEQQRLSNAELVL